MLTHTVGRYDDLVGKLDRNLGDVVRKMSAVEMLCMS